MTEVFSDNSHRSWQLSLSFVKGVDRTHATIYYRWLKTSDVADWYLTKSWPEVYRGTLVKNRLRTNETLRIEVPINQSGSWNWLFYPATTQTSLTVFCFTVFYFTVFCFIRCYSLMCSTYQCLWTKTIVLSLPSLYKNSSDEKKKKKTPK